MVNDWHHDDYAFNIDMYGIQPLANMMKKLVGSPVETLKIDYMYPHYSENYLNDHCNVYYKDFLLCLNTMYNEEEKQEYMELMVKSEYEPYDIKLPEGLMWDFETCFQQGSYMDIKEACESCRRNLLGFLGPNKDKMAFFKELHRTRIKNLQFDCMYPLTEDHYVELIASAYLGPLQVFCSESESTNNSEMYIAFQYALYQKKKFLEFKDGFLKGCHPINGKDSYVFKFYKSGKKAFSDIIIYHILPCLNIEPDFIKTFKETNPDLFQFV